VASAESALRTSVADLNAVRVRWALVGGLAVSARTIPHNLRGRSESQDARRAVDRSGQGARLIHRHQPGADLGDYLIAATALTEGLELATLNVGHYPMFPGLARPFPT
jgi:predicted nucleic acid-binding protein